MSSRPQDPRHLGAADAPCWATCREEKWRTQACVATLEVRLSLETFWRHNNYAGFSLVGNVMPGRYVIFHSGSFSDLCDSDHYEGVKLLLITDILQDYGTIHAEVEPRQLNTHLPFTAEHLAM